MAQEIIGRWDNPRTKTRKVHAMLDELELLPEDPLERPNFLHSPAYVADKLGAALGVELDPIAKYGVAGAAIINDAMTAAYEGGGGGAAIGYFTAESLATVTAPDATYQNAASLTVLGSEQVADATYLGIWTTDRSKTSAGTSNTRLRKDGAADVDVMDTTLKDTSPYDSDALGGLFLHSAGAVPVDVNYTVQTNMASGTATLDNSRVSLLEFGANDEWAEDLTGPGAIIATTPTDAITLDLPAGGHDWLVLAFGLLTQANAIIRYDLTDGTTTTGEVRPATKGASGGHCPVMTAIHLPAYAGGTVRFRAWTANASFGVTPSRLRIVALRLDRFPAAAVQVLGANAGGTDIAYTPAHSQTFNPTAAPHLTIATGAFRSNSSTISIYARFDDGGVVVQEAIREATSGDDAIPFYTHRVADYAAASRTQSLDRQSQTTSVTNTLLAGGLIASLALS